MITHNPDKIEERLEAHESNLSTLEISVPAGMAFAVQTRPIHPSQPRILSKSQFTPRPDNNHHIHGPSRPMNNVIHCNNCGRAGHPTFQCYAQGGGLAGQAPWMQNHRAFNNNAPHPPMYKPTPAVTRPPQQPHQPNPASDTPVHLVGQTKDIIMMATAPHTHIIPVQSLISSTSLLHNDSHIWLIVSAASSHISGNLPLFFDMVTVVKFGPSGIFPIFLLFFLILLAHILSFVTPLLLVCHLTSSITNDRILS